MHDYDLLTYVLYELDNVDKFKHMPHLFLLVLTATKSRSMRLRCSPGTPTAKPLSEYLINLLVEVSCTNLMEGSSLLGARALSS